MKTKSSGFTLVEIIVVIVLIGILAATAVPQFIDLSGAAEEAKTNSIASGLGSASALNHANNIANDAGLTVGGMLLDITNCNQVGTLLDTPLDANYVIQAGAIASEGDAAICTVFFDSNSNATLDAGEASSTFTAYNVDAP